MKNANVYVVSVRDEVLTTCTSWRNAYLTMLAYFFNHDGSWTLENITHDIVDDMFMWMNTETGECVPAVIDETELDDMMPPCRY